MRIIINGNTLEVSEMMELNAATAPDFRKRIMGKMPVFPEDILICFRMTRFIDSSGLGALFAIYKTATALNPNVRIKIVDPIPSIIQLLQLTQGDRFFEIVSSSKKAADLV